MTLHDFSKCFQCNANIAPDSAYCPECGTPIALPKQVEKISEQHPGLSFCTHCGNTLASDEAFCSKCGQPASSDVLEKVQNALIQKPLIKSQPEATKAKIKVFRCPDCSTPLVPGDPSCLKCGKRLVEPVPRVVEDKPNATYQDPILEGKEYYCPKCHAVLETGIRQCTSCGVQFMNPVPEYKLPSWEVERLEKEEERLRQQKEVAIQAAERERKAKELRQKNEALARRQAEAREASRIEAVRKAKLETQIQEDAARLRSQEDAARLRSQEDAARLRFQEDAARLRSASETQVSKCTHCDKPLQPNALFCRQCGSKVELPSPSILQPPVVSHCAGCGNSLTPSNNFCGKCGWSPSSTATPSQPPPALGRRLPGIIIVSVLALFLGCHFLGLFKFGHQGSKYGMVTVVLDAFPFLDLIIIGFLGYVVYRFAQGKEI